MFTVAISVLEQMARGTQPDRGLLLIASLELRALSHACPADLTFYNAAAVLKRFAQGDTWRPANDVCTQCHLLASEIRELIVNG